MAALNKIRITSNGDPEDTHIFVDDVELTNVTRMTINTAVQMHMIAEITLRVYIDELNIDGVAVVHRSAREVARLTDIEALDRCLQLLGVEGERGDKIDTAIAQLSDLARRYA